MMWGIGRLGARRDHGPPSSESDRGPRGVSERPHDPCSGEDSDSATAGSDDSEGAAGLSERVVRGLVASRIGNLVLLLLVSALVALPGVFGSRVLQITVTTMLINLILVISLQVFVGNSGVFSFGHVAFMAMGAYAVGIARIPPNVKSALFPRMPEIQLDPVTAVVVGGLVAAAVALIIGPPLMRLTGLVAGLATFALLNIVFIVSSNWHSVTGGSTGLNGVPQTTTPLVALAWTGVAILIAWLFRHSNTALQLRASREDEVAARSLGIGVMKQRTTAFVISAFIAGLAGGLFAQFFGTFNAEAFFLKTTFAIVAMLVIGGALSLTGALMGTLFVTLVSEGLRRIESGVELASWTISFRPGLQQLGVALAMLAVLLFLPSGITRGREWTIYRPSTEES